MIWVNIRHGNNPLFRLTLEHGQHLLVPGVLAASACFLGVPCCSCSGWGKLGIGLQPELLCLAACKAQSETCGSRRPHLQCRRLWGFVTCVDELALASGQRIKLLSPVWCFWAPCIPHRLLKQAAALNTSHPRPALAFPSSLLLPSLRSFSLLGERCCAGKGASQLWPPAWPSVVEDTSLTSVDCCAPGSLPWVKVWEQLGMQQPRSGITQSLRDLLLVTWRSWSACYNARYGPTYTP
jgi:hypothetical protein